MTCNGQPRGFNGWAGFTDGEGRLLLRAMVPAMAHRIDVQADGYEPARREGVTPGSLDAPAEVEIRLAKRR